MVLCLRAIGHGVCWISPCSVDLLVNVVTGSTYGAIPEKKIIVCFFVPNQVFFLQDFPQCLCLCDPKITIKTAALTNQACNFLYINIVNASHRRYFER